MPLFCKECEAVIEAGGWPRAACDNCPPPPTRRKDNVPVPVSSGVSGLGSETGTPRTVCGGEPDKEPSAE